MDVLESNKEHHACDLNANDRLSNELISKTLNDNINSNYENTVDGHYLNNNINAKVTFDNEIKPTYTISESLKPIRGLICLDNTDGFDTTLNSGDTEEKLVLTQQYRIDSGYNNLDIINSIVENTNLTQKCSDNEGSHFSLIENLVQEDDPMNKIDVNENICSINDNHKEDTIPNLKGLFENLNISSYRKDTAKLKEELLHETGNILISNVLQDNIDSNCYKNQDISENSIVLKVESEKISSYKSDTITDYYDKMEDNNKTTSKNINIKDDTTDLAESSIAINQHDHDESSKQGENILSRNSLFLHMKHSHCEEDIQDLINAKDDVNPKNISTIMNESIATVKSPSDCTNEINKTTSGNKSSPQDPCNTVSEVTDQIKNTTEKRHTKFLNTLKHMNEKKRPTELSFEEFLNRGRSRPCSESYKTRVHTVTFADDEKPLHTINYARERFDDAYLSGYHDQVTSSRVRTSPCSSERARLSPTGSARKLSPGTRTSTRRLLKSANRTPDGKENNYNSFDVYNIETSMPQIDLEAIETHLIKATKEERRRRNDREEIRKRLANGTNTEPVDKGGKRKPNLQTRLQNGMNLQICFMNETPSDDNESPNSEGEPKSLPPNNNTRGCHGSSNNQPQSLSCHISNNNKTNNKYTCPSTNKLTLPLNSIYTSDKVSSVADFFACQAELQAEARKALSESKENARQLMAEERETHPVSPITEIIRTSLSKVGITFPKDRRRLSRQLLTDMNVAQLQVIVNDLHTQIEYLNEKLVRYLMERDELHMTQDSMLVDIEDLTRYLSAKQKSMKSEAVQNNNTTKMFSSLKPQMNRIATLVKK